MAPRAQGADPRTEHLFRYPSSTYAVGTQLIVAVLTMFWVFGSLHMPAVISAIPGLNSDLDVWHQPAVTSASEVLTQTYRSGGVVQWPARWALNPKVRKEQSYMTVCRIVRQNRTLTWYLRGDPVDPERAHFSIVVLFVVVSVPQIQEQIVESCWYSQEQIQQRTGERLYTFQNHGDFPVPQVVEEIAEEIL